MKEQKPIPVFQVMKPGAFEMIEVNYDAVKLYKERALEKNKPLDAKAYQELLTKLDELKAQDVEITTDVFEDTVNALLEELKKKRKEVKQEGKNPDISDERKKELKAYKKYYLNARMCLEEFSYKERQEAEAASLMLLLVTIM